MAGLSRGKGEKEHSCSWVDLVGNGTNQLRKYFCSHNWGEPFRDFSMTIEHHAREYRAMADDAYWICVYANDQWKVRDSIM